jgi:hypothetical protein
MSGFNGSAASGSAAPGIESEIASCRCWSGTRMLPTCTGREDALVARLLSEDRSGESRFLYRSQGREYRRRWPLAEGPFRDLTETDLVDVSCWRFEPGSCGATISRTNYSGGNSALDYLLELAGKG